MRLRAEARIQAKTYHRRRAATPVFRGAWSKASSRARRRSPRGRRGERGLCTTPGVELAVTCTTAPTAASSSPRRTTPVSGNALKLLDEKGEFLSDAQGKRVLALAEEDCLFPEVDALGRVLVRESYNDEHIRQCWRSRWSMPRRCAAAGSAWWSMPSNSVGGTGDPAAAARAGLRGRGAQLRAHGAGFAHNPETAAGEPPQVAEAIVREGRPGRGGRSRRGPAGAGERGRLDVRRGVYAGGRGGLRAVAHARRYGVEPRVRRVRCATSRSATGARMLRGGRGRGERGGEDEGDRRRDRRRGQRQRDLSPSCTTAARRAGGRGALPVASGRRGAR